MYLYMTSINRAVLFPEVHESCGVGETGATCYTKIILAYNVPNMHAMVIKLCHWVAYYVSNNGHQIVRRGVRKNFKKVVNLPNVTFDSENRFF